MSQLLARSQLPFTVDEVFGWHARPGALERLTPPWQPARILLREGGLDGGCAVLGVPFGPLTLRWTARHRDFIAGRQFVDEQTAGPFRRWIHTHRFSEGPAGCRVEDDVDYELPLGALGRAIAGDAMRARLQRLFEFRHAQLRADLARHATARQLGPMRIAVSGASGLVGRALCAFLSTGGHDVVRLVRRASGPGELAWDPERGLIDRLALVGFDAVVHLAGASINRRWTAEAKRVIARSRIDGTRTLADAIARLPVPLRVLVVASAIGFYGDRGDEPVDETSTAGSGFLADVCHAWEAVAQPAARAGVRVVNARLGIVLTPAGGALARILPAFRAGAGGPIGDGTQPVSWISIDDAVYALFHLLTDARLHGPVNLTAPGAVPQVELARALGRTLGRPASLSLPSPLVNVLFGEMGRALLLGGARVAPRRLGETGYRFRHETLDEALSTLLGRRAPADAGHCEVSFAGA
jgi:uncharacterized protein